jgi:hypothetical protein
MLSGLKEAALAVMDCSMVTEAADCIGPSIAAYLDGVPCSNLQSPDTVAPLSKSKEMLT